MNRRSAWIRAAGLTVTALVAMLAMGFVGYELYLAERPVPPPAGAGPTRVEAPLTDRVVIVVVDALREDTAFDPSIMPAFNSVADRGASGVSITPPMTLTTISVLDLGTGMTPGISWSLKNFDAEPFEDESLLSLLGETGAKVALLGDASWTQLFGRYAETTLSIPDRGFYKGADDDMIGTDVQVFDEAEQVLADPSYDVVVIHVVGTDKAAHRNGAHRREPDGSLSFYARRAAAVDARIARLLERFGDRGTWLLLADHGVNRSGNHGGGEEEARRAPFAMAGPPVVSQRGVEQPMTTIAPTMAVLLGLRSPRTAEVPANFGLLSLSETAQAHHALSHLRAREGYTQGYLAMLGAAVDMPHEDPLESARHALESGDPSRAVVVASNGMGILEALLTGADQDRGGTRALGVLLGLLIQAGIVYLIGREAGIPRPHRPALLWAGISWAVLYFGGWQFTLIWLLGELFRSWSHVSWHGPLTLGLLAAVAAAVLLIRRIPRLNALAPAWLAFALVALFLGQSVMRWPYGPLEQTYRFLLVVGLGGYALVLLRQRSADGRRVLAALVATVAMFLLGRWLIEVGEAGRVEDTTVAHVLSYAGAAGLLGWLGWDSLRTVRGSDAAGARRQAWLLMGITAALFVVAAAYHETSAPWLVKTFVLALALPVVLLRGTALPPRAVRNILFSLAFVSYRALSIDARVVMVASFATALLLLSGARPKRSPLTVPASVGLCLLLHQSYFYEVGHAFSFSAIDVSVAFAATRDAIHLGEGFLLILLQHLGPWLMVATALVYNRVQDDDWSGLRAAMVALIGAFAIQCWGAFASFEYELDNHWFTVHALPLFLFAMCNALLVGFSLVLASPLAPAGHTLSARSSSGTSR